MEHAILKCGIFRIFGGGDLLQIFPLRKKEERRNSDKLTAFKEILEMFILIQRTLYGALSNHPFSHKYNN